MRRFPPQTASANTFFALATVLAVLTIVTPTRAAIVNNSVAASFTVANDDLLQTSLDSVVTTGNFQGQGTTGETTLRNGVWEDGAYGNDSPAPSAGRADSAIADNAVATYQLDLGANAPGYDITQIDLYSNWGPGQGRDEIRVTIQYATVGQPNTFVSIVTNQVYNPPTLTQGKMSITPSAGLYLAQSVSKIRFTWPSPQENGYVGYSELDVFGVQAIPTPAALPTGLMLMGALMMRRRLGNKA